MADRVILLEQGDQFGAEASAQNAGMMRRLAHDSAERALAVRSAPNLVSPPTEDWKGREPFRKTGAVVALGSTASSDMRGALQVAADDLASSGVVVEEVSGNQLASLAPALAGAPIETAWHLPDEGVLDAHSLVQGFVCGARQAGVSLHCGVRTLRLLTQETDDGRRIMGVETDQGKINADLVVIAAGAWSAILGSTAGAERSLTPLARHLLHSPEHPLSDRTHPWCWYDDVGVYVRPEGGGWLCSPCDETEVRQALGPGSAGPVESLGRALAHAKVEANFPALDRIRLNGGWTGLRTFAPDRRPVVGEDSACAGLWWAAGLGGFGVTCCFAVGELVTALMAGESVSWIDPKKVAPNRSGL